MPLSMGIVLAWDNSKTVVFNYPYQCREKENKS
jgi:hypothetical protein